MIAAKRAPRRHRLGAWGLLFAAFAVMVAVVLSYVLGPAVEALRLVRTSAPARRRGIQSTDNGSRTTIQEVEEKPERPADEPATVRTLVPVATVQTLVWVAPAVPVTTLVSLQPRRHWLRASLAGATCLAGVATVLLLARRITGWDDVILGAWIASGAALFLPLGALLRLGRWLLSPLRPARAPGEELATARYQPVAEGAGAPPARTAASPWPIRWSQAALIAALYVGFVVGAIYYTPAALSEALDAEHPMASVTSASMWPTLKKGDLVILKGVDRANDLEVGDIIGFKLEDGGFAIHRVISIDGDKITTQGDANPYPDPSITFDQVIGRVPKVGGRLAKVPYLGNIGLLLGPLFNHTTSDDGAMSEAAFEGQQSEAGGNAGSGGAPSPAAGAVSGGEKQSMPPQQRPEFSGSADALSHGSVALPTIAAAAEPPPVAAAAELTPAAAETPSAAPSGTPSVPPQESPAGAVGALPVAGSGRPPVTPEPAESPVTLAPDVPTFEYQVQPGDTLFDIALRFGATVEALVQLNELTSAQVVWVRQVLIVPGTTPAEPPAAPPTPPSPTLPNVPTQEYTVRAGESLADVATFFGTTVQTIVALNGLADANLIVPGQVLLVPALPATTAPGQAFMSEYVVQPGETLTDIAAQFGTTVEALAAENNLANPSAVRVGDRLLVP
jgi:signal peptidase I